MLENQSLMLEKAHKKLLGAKNIAGISADAYKSVESYCAAAISNAFGENSNELKRIKSAFQYMSYTASEYDHVEKDKREFHQRYM